MTIARRTFVRYAGMAAIAASMPVLASCASDASVQGEADSQQGSGGQDVEPKPSTADVEADPSQNDPDSPSAGTARIDAGLLCVTEYAGSALSVLDPETLELVNRISIGQNPTMLAQGAGMLFMSDSGSGSVYMIPCEDAAGFKAVSVGLQPIGLCYDDSRGRLNVADYHSANISAIDVSLASVVESWNLGTMGYQRRTDPPECCRVSPGVGRRPVALALSTSGDVLYSLNYGTYDIARIDIESGELLDDFDGTVGPRTLIAMPDGATLLAAGVGGEVTERISSLYQYDCATGKRLLEIEVGQAVADVCLVPDGSVALAIARDDGLLVGFSTADFSEVGRCQLDEGIDALDVSEDGSKAFVSNSSAGTVTAVDLSMYSPVATASGFAAPKDILVVKGA